MNLLGLGDTVWHDLIVMIGALVLAWMQQRTKAVVTKRIEESDKAVTKRVDESDLKVMKRVDESDKMVKKKLEVIEKETAVILDHANGGFLRVLKVAALYSRAFAEVANEPKAVVAADAAEKELREYEEKQTRLEMIKP